MDTPSYTLIGIEGWFSGETFYTSGNNTLIGRSPGCQIQIEDPAVSKQHARLFFQDNRWFIEDLNSSNGTYVNSRFIQNSKCLKANDVIQLGTHSFQFSPGLPGKLRHPKRIFKNKWGRLIFFIMAVLGIFGLIFMAFSLIN